MHRFVDSALATQAYEDTSLPIGLSQTISKPSVVRHMLALLFDGACAREQGHLGLVLEIGTGCGYFFRRLCFRCCRGAWCLSNACKACIVINYHRNF